MDTAVTKMDGICLHFVFTFHMKANYPVIAYWAVVDLVC